jgi:pimeloyl-ACP methyl ester carboxylesterase
VRYILSGQGRPVIVLVNGAGVPLEAWRGLYPAVERLGRVLAWNRPGLPGSDAAPRRTSSADVVAALRELLSRLGLPPPYVLVGHSLGGMHAQLFARLHPADVAGLLLIEPTPVDAGLQLLRQRGHLVRALAKVTGLPADSLRRNVRAELAGFGASVRALAEAGPMPGVPLRAVVRRGGHFPQITQPRAVIAELRALVSSAHRAMPRPVPATPADLTA